MSSLMAFNDGPALLLLLLVSAAPAASSLLLLLLLVVGAGWMGRGVGRMVAAFLNSSRPNSCWHNKQYTANRTQSADHRKHSKQERQSWYTSASSEVPYLYGIRPSIPCDNPGAIPYVSAHTHLLQCALDLMRHLHHFLDSSTTPLCQPP
jgi:hypothetical protein